MASSKVGGSGGLKGTRYMDVLTTRSSHKADSLSKMGPAATGRLSKDHTRLLVEPVVLPEMTHLSVDDAREVNPPCLFYPTGAKNASMRRSMEVTVRKVRAPDQKVLITRSATVLSSPQKKKVLDPTMPVEPLVYSRSKGRADRDVAQLLKRKRDVEQQLSSTVLGVHCAHT